ncbi:MAG: RNA polymerase sigma factor RpoH, partial [Betaproteobacteria bacterium]
MTHLSGTSANALTVSNPWALVPALGNLDAYIAAVIRLPMLTLEQEQEFARKMRADNDVEAAGKLVLSHLRLVVSVARQYLGYGLPHGDLIQEGNIGLMKAVRRFDPDHGVRLVSYALHWIKAEIHEYILKNWRMVKVATTKSQRKLFFNLRSMKQGFKADAAAGNEATHRDTLNEVEIESMARELKVKREDVVEMETRLSGGDVMLDPGPGEDGEDSFGPIAYLADARHEPTAVIESQQRDLLASDGIALALSELDERSRRIVQERWLKVNDNGSGGMT